MNIRPFQESDAKEASRVMRESLNLHGDDYPQHIVNFVYDFLSLESLLERTEDTAFFLAVEEGEILGTVGVCGNEARSLYVPEQHGRKGIGKELIAHAENIVRKAGHRKIIVYSTITAHNFYLQLGYRDIEEIEQENFGKSILMEKEF